MMKNLLHKNQRQKGQSMLEAVAALGVIAIVMTALTIAVLLGLGNSGYSKKNNLATQYAQQGMEIIRNMRETDGTAFWVLNKAYYLPNSIVDSANNAPVDICSGKNPPSTAPKIGDTYIRTFCVDATVGAGCDRKVTVSVWWQDGKCPDNGYCKKASIASCFADLRAPTPTPIPL